MTGSFTHPDTAASTAPIDVASSQPFSASRLMAGGLSLLLVLALALAAGVPAGQLLATVSGTTHGDVDRAVAPKVVERQERRLAQERPVAAGADRVTGCRGCASGSRWAARTGTPVGASMLREALLALPPPARTA